MQVSLVQQLVQMQEGLVVPPESLSGRKVVPVLNISKESFVVGECPVMSPTVSKPLPLNALSVVAATFPPFLWRSHAMSLLLNCGSISATWSICAGFTRTAARFAAARVPGAASADLLRYHRETRKMTTTKIRTWGTLTLCSAMAGLAI